MIYNIYHNWLLATKVLTVVSVAVSSLLLSRARLLFRQRLEFPLWHRTRSNCSCLNFYTGKNSFHSPVNIWRDTNRWSNFLNLPLMLTPQFGLFRVLRAYSNFRLMRQPLLIAQPFDHEMTSENRKRAL